MEPNRTAGNKDLILREKLAIERTVMAKDRMQLSFIRTALYFIVTGLTLNQLVSIWYGVLVSVGYFGAGICLLAAGRYKYYQQLRNIKESRRHIGGYVADTKE